MGIRLEPRRINFVSPSYFGKEFLLRHRLKWLQQGVVVAMCGEKAATS